MRFSVAILIGMLSIMECLADSNKLWNQTDVDRLKQDLLTNYNRLTRPENQNTVTKCHLQLTVIHIELDETRGVLTTHAWLKMNWTDSKLSWDNGSYDGITEIRITADEVWQPDLTVYNSAEPNIVDHFAKTNKILYYNGMVLWVPTAKFETYCPMNLKLWPFDEQKCRIMIGSWTFSAYQIDLQLDSDPVDVKHYNNHTEWAIVKTSAQRNSRIYDCCPEPYTDITFDLVVQRRTPMFKAIVVTPAIVVVFMTLVSFWLPPQASFEKLFLNGVTVISILLVFFSQLLPMLATSTPLIVTFYSHTLFLLCISFVISVIVINLSRNRKQYAVPHSIKANILDGFIGKVLVGLQPESLSAENHSEELRETPFEEHRHSDDHQIIQTPPNTKPNLIRNDWIRLAIFIDRLTFFIYVFTFIIMGFLHFI